MDKFLKIAINASIEAGKSIMEIYDTNMPLEYNKENLLNNYFLVSK